MRDSRCCLAFGWVQGLATLRDLVCGSGQNQRRGKTPLMFQFVSHCVQQLRHVKGLLKGPSCSEQFRDI